MAATSTGNVSEEKNRGEEEVEERQRKWNGERKRYVCTYARGSRESRNARTVIEKEKETPKVLEDGVKRTHREPRSHDLMNELAWLLATWWENYSPSFSFPLCPS